MKHTIADVTSVTPELRLYHNRIGLFNTHFQNFKHTGIPKAQLILTDIPYNIGKDAYGSNPVWYVGGDNKNGESELAGEEFFDTDKDFRPAEFMHFCSQMLRPEPKERGKAPCMIVFCEFEQQFYLIELARRYGFEIKKNIYSDACDLIRKNITFDLFNESEQIKKRKQFTQTSLF